MKPDTSCTDALIDQLYATKHQRISDIHTKGKNFNVRGESIRFKGLEAYEYSYFFLKETPAFNPGTVLETEDNREYVVLTTETSKAAHNITRLLPLTHVATAFVEKETGLDDDGNPIYELQLAHRYLQCSFDGKEVRCFEFSAPLTNMILRIDNEYFKIIKVSTQDLTSTLSVKPHMVQK